MAGVQPSCEGRGREREGGVEGVREGGGRRIRGAGVVYTIRHKEGREGGRKERRDWVKGRKEERGRGLHVPTFSLVAIMRGTAAQAAT